MTSTQPVSHLKISTALAISLLTALVGAAVALIPSLAPYKAVLIAALTAVVIAVGLIANALHALAGAKLNVGVVEADLQAAVKKELARIFAAASEHPAD